MNIIVTVHNLFTVVQYLFTTVLNMSINASFVALAVMLVRFALRIVPKIFSYVLWTVVLFRLICPISFTSDFSILALLKIPQSADIIKCSPRYFGLILDNIDFTITPTAQESI